MASARSDCCRASESCAAATRRLPLPPKAFDTLLLLVRQPGHLMSKSELMKALWPDSFVEEVNLANNISLLRKVLRDNAGACSFIQTVPKLGYRFLPAVTSVWRRSSPAATFRSG